MSKKKARRIAHLLPPLPQVKAEMTPPGEMGVRLRGREINEGERAEGKKDNGKGYRRIVVE